MSTHIYSKRPGIIVAVMTALILVAGCGKTEPTATALAPANTPRPSSTPAPPTLTPQPTRTPAPPTLTPQPTHTPAPPTLTPTSIPPTATPHRPSVPMGEPGDAPISLVDSGQRLGSARSWDVALGDLDGDGDLDAFVANGVRGDASSAVWLNDGLGVFTAGEQRLGYGMGVELGDLDGDGDLDAVLVSWDEPGKVWLNQGGAQGGTPGIFADRGQNLGSAGGMDVALGDLDGDGDLDAYFGNKEANTVWLNDGGGAFNDSGQRLGAAYSAGVGLGDLDGDGDLDALAVGWGEPGKVWLNDGAGTFADSGQALTPGHVHIHGMTLGDVDGDGDLDAFLAGDPSTVWLNDGAGTFAESGQSLRSRPGDTVALGDLDGDGDLDAYLAVGVASGADDKVWLNAGDGRFDDSGAVLSDVFSSGIGLGDLDGDGDLDAFVVHGELGRSSGGNVPNEVWLNLTEAQEQAAAAGVSFVDSRQRLGAGGNVLDAALGDLDGDGDLDAVVANGEFEEGNAVLLNDGAGTFVDSGQSFGRVSGLALGDLDGDGDLDAFAVALNRAGRVWLNDGGTFVDSEQRLGTVHGRKVALGDLDSDGDLDAFVAREQEPNMVWLNDGGLQGGTPGNFTDSGQSLGNGNSDNVALGDLDSDGDLDALTAGFDEPGIVWFNDGRGVLNASSQVSSRDSVRDVALGDADGDGDLDIFMTIFGAPSEWLWYNAGGTFVDSGQSLPGHYVGGIALGDLDSDGDLDAFIGVDTGGPDGVSSGNMVWLNDGGVFADSGLRLGQASSQSVVLGDLDGDGDLDAFVVNREEFSVPNSHPEALITNKVWFNTTP